MDLRILYDNDAKKGFLRGWGFSCLIGDRLLFDVGADIDKLLFNMRKLSVKLDDIERVVLSHEHGDHVGGLSILSMLGDVEVLVPSSFSMGIKRRLVAYENVSLAEIDEAREISKGFYTTGELGRFIKEQSLIVETDKGLTVVTGCSHPGLGRILNAASRFGSIHGVVGGFHDFNNLERLKDINLIVPCHCTARKKEILTLYPETSVKCSAGCIIKV